MTEAWKEYKKSKQTARRFISLAKRKTQKECASDLNDPNHQNDIFRMAKQMVKEHTHTHTQPFYGSLDFVWDNPVEPVPEETFTH